MRIQKNINKGILSWSNTVRRVRNKIQDHFFLLHLRLFTPKGDQDRISPYNIKQKSDEKKEKYKSGDYQLIQYQILQTNITRTAW